MYQSKGKILAHEEIIPNYMLMVIEIPEVARKAEMGQFVQISCSGTYEPLLRRPISIHEINKVNGTISLLYQVKGKGTQLLKEKAVNTEVNLIGPLGKGFTLPQGSQEKILIVGGGIGTAPLLALAKDIFEKGHEATVVLGFNSGEYLLRLEEFAKYSRNLLITTMDGSYGEKGLVTLPLERELATGKYDLIYTCGPEIMLKNVAKLAEQYGVKCQVSLEAYMACGIGVCLGCVCKTKVEEKEAFQRVCMEGPVFESREVVWADA